MKDAAPKNIAFMKMHGLGNDFVVFDGRRRDLELSPELVTAIADRHRGVGFDQMAVIETNKTQVTLRFFNADGSISAACGNATRCIARFLMDEAGVKELTLRTDRGTLEARDAGDGLTSVNMGQPQLDWREIPLSEDVDVDALPIDGSPLATGMGNPHCTFFVNDLARTDIAELGAAYEHHPLFPERTNVQAAEVVGTDHLVMRVWERGVGLTLASGSSSCAVVVAAVRRGLTGRTVTVDLDGGRIGIDWRADGVWMTGPTAHVFSGTLTAAFLESVA